MKHEKTVVAVSFPKGFDPIVEYTPEGDAVVRMRVAVREIEASPIQMTDEFMEFANRADLSKIVTEMAFDAAFRAFFEEFRKQSVLSKLRVTVED